MRIHEVSKQTGLTKKAIHFYVTQGLLHPLKLDNNYYEFSNEDIQLLHQIIAFRKAGISIQTIKEIYDYPAATNFFLHRSFHQLKQELTEKMTQLENLEMILETIPPNGTPVDVGNLNQDNFINHPEPHWLDTKHPDFDERMIAILILAPFMDIQVDEYKQYLWDKIFNDLKNQFKDNLKILSNMIYFLSGEQIRDSSTFQFNLLKKIAYSEDLSEDVSYLMDCIQQLYTNDELAQKWILLHDPVLIPVLNFFKRTSEKKRISQYNPLFEQYTDKMKTIIHECVSQIKDTPFEKELTLKLKGNINIEDECYSDLFLIFTFHKSIYSQCSISEIKQCLL